MYHTTPAPASPLGPWSGPGAEAAPLNLPTPTHVASGSSLPVAPGTASGPAGKQATGAATTTQGPTPVTTDGATASQDVGGDAVRPGAAQVDTVATDGAGARADEGGGQPDPGMAAGSGPDAENSNAVAGALATAQPADDIGTVQADEQVLESRAQAAGETTAGQAATTLPPELANTAQAHGGETERAPAEPKGWRNCNQSHPCPICRHHDWCSYSPSGDWAICRRESSHPTFGAGREKTDASGAAYYAYRLTPHSAPSGWPAPRHHHTEAKGTAADADTRNRVYTTLLQHLPLTGAHVEDLARRGLPANRSWLARRGYRTLGKGRAKAAQALVRGGLEKDLPGVPGVFVQEKEGRRYWSVAGSGGLLLPVADSQSRIVALMVRVDGATGNKYQYVSSKKHGGASPGTPVHVPPFPLDRKLVRVTEGVLKADIASELSGVLTIGVPGVVSWRAAIAVLRELGAETARVAYDADCRTNRAVARSLAKLVQGIRDAGMAAELEVWDAADGKGIDDLLAAGKKPVVLRDDAEVDQAVAEIVAAAEKANPPLEARAVEADDDPHRLARLYLAAQDPRTPPQADGPVVRYWRDQFWRWNGAAYLHLPDGELAAELNAFTKAEFDRLARERPGRPPGSSGPAHKAPQVRRVTGALVSNVQKALAGIAVVPGTVEQPSWLGDLGIGNAPNYVALTNGLLDLDGLLADRRDVLRPHSPRWFSPVCLPYPFEAGADCLTWRAFLDHNLEGDQERIALLQEWFGFCLTFDTSQQKFLALEGEGANGKSVICAALTAVLGKANVAHVPLECFGQRFALTQTLGKLANIASEVGEIDKAAEGVLKAFTAGDRMTFDRKNLSSLEAMPTARFVFATNNRPRFSDRSGGLWRRMILFPLRCTIPEGQRVCGMDHPEWWQAQGELPGIFGWAVVGLARLREQGRFTASRVCGEALEQYRTESNPARMFLLEACRESDGPEVVVKAVLYRAYRDWCAENGRQPLAHTEFGKEVRRAFPGVKTTKVDYQGRRCDAYAHLTLDPGARPDPLRDLGGRSPGRPVLWRTAPTEPGGVNGR